MASDKIVYAIEYENVNAQYSTWVVEALFESKDTAEYELAQLRDRDINKGVKYRLAEWKIQ